MSYELSAVSYQLSA